MSAVPPVKPPVKVTMQQCGQSLSLALMSSARRPNLSAAHTADALLRQCIGLTALVAPVHVDLGNGHTLVCTTVPTSHLVAQQ